VAAYHQMGHNSENLLFESGLASFRGAILSPVNYEPSRAIAQVERVRKDLPDHFDLILDPQLYLPASDRGELRQWSYFPTDVDTADLTSQSWWHGVNANLVRVGRELRVGAICSPATLPRADSFIDSYYSHVVEVGSDLREQCQSDLGMRVLQTAVVGLRELAVDSRPLEVASLLSNTKADEIYLIFYCDALPRRELSASDQLSGAARLVAELKRAGLKILVGFCAADMLIWKAAGADSCATGKFFNLRRFTRSRFEDPMDGGQNIAYFFEEALLAFLREADVRRVRQRGSLSTATHRNPFAEAILDKLDTQPGAAWVGDGWRQFLFWFADCEERTSRGEDVERVIAFAENLWLEFGDAKFFMEEPRNDGSWVRPWRIAALAGRP
jgi:hypothetical protein